MGPILLGVLLAHKVSTVVGRARYIECVFDDAHRFAVFAFPTTFVEALIEIVVVVPKNMV